LQRLVFGPDGARKALTQECDEALARGRSGRFRQHREAIATLVRCGLADRIQERVNLRSGRFKNASTDRELSNVIRDGVAGTAMAPNAYSDSELTALVSYLRNFGSFDLGSSAKPGDPERGRQLFQGKGDCGSCHRVNGVGPRMAPDLSNIGAIRTAGTLQRYLLDPTDAMLPINRPVRVVKRDGTVIVGRRVNEDTHTVQLIDSHERLVSLDKSQLREYSIGAKATMPSYADVFDEDERADLVAYLLSLKGTN
jgi:putative heme-binding domain-containing protein